MFAEWKGWDHGHRPLASGTNLTAQLHGLCRRGRWNSGNFSDARSGRMLAALQRRLLLILTIGLFLTLGVVAYTCRAALGYDRLNDQVQRNHEVKEELSAVLRLVVDAAISICSDNPRRSPWSSTFSKRCQLSVRAACSVRRDRKPW